MAFGTDDHLNSLHSFLCQQYCFSPTDPPLFRSELLQAKRTELLAELDSHISISSGILGGAANEVVKRKRNYQAANREQLSLEERLTKRARVTTDAKRRRLR